MTTEQIEQMIQSCLVELFALEPARITPAARLAEDLGIDSIDVVDLLEHVRRLTGRKLSAEDFRAVRTVDDLVQVLARLVPA